MSRKLPSLGIPALLLAAPLIFFHRLCFMGEAFLLRDLFDWFYPWRTFAADSFARGDFPLWNPYSYMGTPFLANMQSGLLYPPNVVFWLFDFPNAMRLFLIIQFALAAWFMYLLLRALSCRHCSSLTGALGYAYGGWMVVHIEFPNKLAAAAWLPLIMLGVVRWRQGRPLAGLVLGAFATACCVTAGYPQTSFTVLVGAGVIWATWIAQRIFAQRTARAAVPEAASLPSIALLGALIAAAQIVPFLEALSLAGYRAGLEPEKMLKLSMHPIHFLDLLWPHLFGLPGYARYWGGNLLQFWLGHFYCGLATLALAAVGLLGVGRRVASSEQPGHRDAILGGATLLVLATAFCMGNRTPLAPFCVRYLPGFVHFRWLSTTSILIAFALCWLAAFGQEALLDALERRQPAPRRVRFVLLGGAAALIAPGLLALVSAESLQWLVETICAPIIVGPQTTFIAGTLDLVRADAVFAGLMAAILAGIWWGASTGRLRAGLFGALIPLALFVDLKVASTRINFSTSPAIYREVPARARELMAKPGSFDRLYVTDKTREEDLRLYGSERVEEFRWAADTMIFNLNLPWRLFSASDGDPMYSSRWKLFNKWIDGKDDEARGRLLALAGIGLVLNGRLSGPAQAIEIPVRLPRVHVAAGARRLPMGEVFKAMLRPDWNPYTETIVEDDFPGEPRAGSGHPIEHRIHALTYTNNTVTIDVESAQPGYLVLGDSAFPGWRAWVDSRPTAIFTANFLFRGVDLPAGRHLVRFEYHPASVRWGAAGSIAGLMALVGAALIERRRRKAAPPDG